MSSRTGFLLLSASKTRMFDDPLERGSGIGSNYAGAGCDHEQRGTGDEVVGKNGSRGGCGDGVVERCG
ncbi:predicted protein [Histoplasma mississippiense (nom. inval.)]|uniref:predicted protein n=1 Tax=Ajellomyces capsulatus (strain NAm1 / WU24) TaxID=2059318 RepID=UPI000157D329|nr:predicted protein [Histoplasma mississippiense (nom. inval.)]EDN04484.1 predicted protein [Histoplasma mississippiense (nom. inval.)]